MEKNTLFVDTGAWFALADKSDQYHSKAVKIYPKLLSSYNNLKTTNLVIAETYNLIRRALGHQAAITFLENIAGGKNSTEISRSKFQLHGCCQFCCYDAICNSKSFFV